jgi:hypothetical protein
MHGEGEVEIKRAWNGSFSYAFCNLIEFSNVQNISITWIYKLDQYSPGVGNFLGDFNVCGVSKFDFEPALNQSCGFVQGVYASRYLPYMGTLIYENGEYTWTPPEKVPDYLSIWVRPKFCTALPISGNGFDCPIGSCTTRTLAAGTQCVITGAGCGPDGGTCARNDINQFPWFSPAGTSRGTILNAVKLSYNPGRVQRDKLYSNRINPVIFSPGAGIILFGDKTGYGKSSAFDRINVRRLFIYLENAISSAAKDQLFEFNDEITRTNFVNIIEPFLRDVQSKRGIFDYVVVCDETNNTPAIIDANEFVADIFIKPARSINFIGLTFVATRTGVAFEEVIGSV